MSAYHQPVYFRHVAPPPDVPLYVVYRGQRRRVWGYIPTTHGGHRHWILKYKRGEAPATSATMGYGPWGQKHVEGVAVRSDLCKPCTPPRRLGGRGRPTWKD